MPVHTRDASPKPKPRRKKRRPSPPLGFIKLHREIRGHPIYKRPLEKLIFIELLLVYDRRTGQALASRPKLAEACGLDPNNPADLKRVDRALAWLAGERMVVPKRRKYGLSVAVTNWEKWQGNGPEKSGNLKSKKRDSETEKNGTLESSQKPHEQRTESLSESDKRDSESSENGNLKSKKRDTNTTRSINKNSSLTPPVGELEREVRRRIPVLFTGRNPPAIDLSCDKLEKTNISAAAVTGLVLWLYDSDDEQAIFWREKVRGLNYLALPSKSGGTHLDQLVRKFIPWRDEQGYASAAEYGDARYDRARRDAEEAERRAKEHEVDRVAAEKQDEEREAMFAARRRAMGITCGRQAPPSAPPRTRRALNEGE